MLPIENSLDHPFEKEAPGVWYIGLDPLIERSGLVFLGVGLLGLSIFLMSLLSPQRELAVRPQTLLLLCGGCLLWGMFILFFQARLTLDVTQRILSFKPAVGRRHRNSFDDLMGVSVMPLGNHRACCLITLKSKECIHIPAMPFEMGIEVAKFIGEQTGIECRLPPVDDEA